MDSPAGSPPPSMGDILASIKRIIADPLAEPPPAADTRPEARPAEPADDILDLGESPFETVTPPSPPSRAAPGEGEPLLSGAARAASLQAMATLSTVAIEAHAPTNTLDGLVRDLLRPMLKEWLDANLPDLVERVVTREVARLRGR